MDVIDICAIVTAVIIFIFSLIITIETIRKTSIEKKRYQLEEIETRNNIELGAESFSLLDLIIDEELLVYTTINMNYKNITEITPKMEEQIRKELAERVANRVSNCKTVSYKLRQLYQYDLGPVIAERVYIRVLRYVIETNETKK